MLNITDAIAALRDAETIISTSLLTKDEKGRLLADLQATVPPALKRPYLLILSEALDRLYGTYVPAAPARPTEGKQDATPMASGPREGPAEAAKGTTQGLAKQAQNAGSLANSGNGGAASTKAAAPTEKPSKGKARK